MKKKLLITGASGFLGWTICQIAQKDWEVYGTYCSQQLDIPNVKLLQLDLKDFSALKQLLGEIEPSAVIHAAACSKPNFCQTYPEESYAVNVTPAWNLAGLCAELGIACTFTSSDLVFDGLHPPYKETDPVSPVSHYGEQKVLAEQGMLERNPRTIICRLPVMFGQVPPTANTFFQTFLKAMQAGEELNLFVDEIRTTTSGTTAAQGLLLALEKSTGGILHLGGKERVSRYEFGRLMAEIFQFPQAKLNPCSQKDVPMAAPRSPDTSLDISGAIALGFQPLSLRQELENLRTF